MSRSNLRNVKDACSHISGVIDEFGILLDKYTQLPDQVREMRDRLIEAVMDMEIALSDLDDD
jgi:hypothetical protein